MKKLIELHLNDKSIVSELFKHTENIDKEILLFIDLIKKHGYTKKFETGWIFYPYHSIQKIVVKNNDR